MNYVDNDGKTRKSSNTKRSQRSGYSLRSLGFGVNFCISASHAISFPIINIDFIWLSSLVKKRYKEGHTHIYKTVFSSSGLGEKR